MFANEAELKRQRLKKKWCYYAIKKGLPKLEVKPKPTGFIYESQKGK